MYCILVWVLELKVRGKASVSAESLTGFAFPISLKQEVLQSGLLPLRLFFFSLRLIFATAETGPTAGIMSQNLVLV